MSLISFDPIFTSVLQVKRLRQHSLINLPKMMQLESGRSRIGPTICDPQSLLANHYLEQRSVRGRMQEERGNINGVFLCAELVQPVYANSGNIITDREPSHSQMCSSLGGRKQMKINSLS